MQDLVFCWHIGTLYLLFFGWAPQSDTCSEGQPSQKPCLSMQQRFEALDELPGNESLHMWCSWLGIHAQHSGKNPNNYMGSVLPFKGN